MANSMYAISVGLGFGVAPPIGPHPTTQSRRVDLGAGLVGGAEGGDEANENQNRGEFSQQGASNQAPPVKPRPWFLVHDQPVICHPVLPFCRQNVNIEPTAWPPPKPVSERRSTHQHANVTRKVVPLPGALAVGRHDGIGSVDRSLHGLDRVPGGLRGMVRHVGGSGGMAGRSCGGGGATGHGLPRGGVRRDRRDPGLADRDLSASPSARRLDGAPGPFITGKLMVEQGHDVLRAIRRPDREQAMSRQVKRAPAVDRLESFVPHIRFQSPACSKA